MAAPTLQEVCDLARIALNDDEKERHPDEPDLLSYCREGLGTMRDVRPDLFVGQFSTFDQTALDLDDAFPINPRYASILVDYLIFRCERIDSEGASAPQAVIAAEWFKARLA